MIYRKCGYLFMTEEEFIKIYVSHQRRVFCFITTLLPRYEDAEEVFQQFSLVIWNKRFEYDESKGDFFRWACGISWNLVRNFKRVDARARRAVSASPELEQLAERCMDDISDTDEMTSALEICLEKLPPKEKQLLYDAYTGETKINEIADHMNMSSTRMYGILKRLRQSLAICIKNQMALIEDQA